MCRSLAAALASLNGSAMTDSTRLPAMANGTAAKLTGYAEQCMAEYDLDGWKAPDLQDPEEMSYHLLRKK